ncbi:hypothetical protein NPX13_g11121 [Xylaria arbuscula]|uniref:Uncharacterized protein n=1 Tax=Xylaria arbuscula TaxID=114810 RepID=A0A9W8TG61_9PEZI|nr:hypothetical protein NPX13_g11121 [Xylaria arbuscula]
MSHRQSLDVQLNAALLDFAPRYMKDQLEHLARECDLRLERDFLPRLHSLLRQVDEERDAFEKQKQDAAHDLRDRLGLLRFDAAAVDRAIGQLDAIAPQHLALFPSPSSLGLPLVASSSTSASTSVSYPTPSTSDSSNDAVEESPETVSGSHAASSLESTPQASTDLHLTSPPSLDCAMQSLIAAENLETACSPKRSKDGRSAEEDDAPCKRQRTIDDKMLAKEHKAKDPIAFPNLLTNVRGDSMASKYWIKEHLGEKPHTFTPTTPLPDSFLRDRTGIIHGNDTDDDFSPPFPKLRESLHTRHSTHKTEHEKPRRTLRNVPRPDYAGMAAPWNVPELEIKKEPKAAKVTRSIASMKRRLTKPGMGSSDSKKPFGYMSEPWPRRSAPR